MSAPGNIPGATAAERKDRPAEMATMPIGGEPSNSTAYWATRPCFDPVTNHSQIAEAGPPLGSVTLIPLALAIGLGSTILGLMISERI
jgi:hypothetical protein